MLSSQGPDLVVTQAIGGIYTEAGEHLLGRLCKCAFHISSESMPCPCSSQPVAAVAMLYGGGAYKVDGAIRRNDNFVNRTRVRVLFTPFSKSANVCNDCAS